MSEQNHRRNRVARFLRHSFLLLAIGLLVVLAGCKPTTPTSQQNKPAVSASGEATRAQLPPAVVGTIEIRGGSTLARDIIPQLCEIFSFSEDEVKSKLASAESTELIGPKIKGFRRMEGIIPPGEYIVREGTTLEDMVSEWVGAAEHRAKRLQPDQKRANALRPSEQLALASMIEAECLSGTHQDQVATVFLNRLADGSKLQSCVTAEYADGYQRPFLTSDDVAIESDYNTYHTAGLPIGPICSVSDDSLRSAMSKRMKSNIYFFYYDYLSDDMFFFSDYAQFRRDATASRLRFEKESKVGSREKINKQALYAWPVKAQ